MTERRSGGEGKRDLVTTSQAHALTPTSSLVRRGLAAMQAKATRRLRFPVDLADCTLYGRVPGGATAWQFLSAARGDVEVPRNLDVQLRIEPVLSYLATAWDENYLYTGEKDLAFLRMLEPDDIQSLYLAPQTDEPLGLGRAGRYQWLSDENLDQLLLTGLLPGLRDLTVICDSVKVEAIFLLSMSS